MNVVISPSTANGKVRVPASKSMAHRYLIASYLSKEKCIINGIEDSEDMKATINCVRALAGSIEVNNKTAIVNCFDNAIDNAIMDNGIDINKEIVLDCNESGSTLRFFIPICMTLGKRVLFKGTEKLLSRPLSVYEEICRRQDLIFEKKENKLLVDGKLKSGEYMLAGNISSQFITGLMFALSLLEKDSTIKIIPPIESRSYIDMTIQVLNEFGQSINWIDDITIKVTANKKYKSGEYNVEGDYSNGAFLDVFNYIAGNVEVSGLKEDSLQGDKIYKEYFEKISEGNVVLDIADCPDLGPVLFALAALKDGAVFTGTRRLKLKESDRAMAMKMELSKCGIELEILEDTVIVRKGILHKPEEPIESHNDHRIVMAMATVLSVVGGEIKNAEAVNKSFPDYFEMIKELGVKFEA